MKRLLPVLFFLVLPVAAHAATLTFGGPSGAAVGGTFNVPVLLTTAAGESANAISGTVTYSTKELTLVAVSKNTSIITLWPTDPTQSAGSAHFEGVILNPGYSGSGGTVITLTFQAKAAGAAAVALSDASVLANDGNATPILSGTSPASIAITDTAQQAPAATSQSSAPQTTVPKGVAQITSSSHPDQTKWYNKNTALLDWTVDANATGMRIGYDKASGGLPTVKYDASLRHKELTLKDGVWYFHVQEQINGSWSSVSTYKLQIDTTPPASMHIRFPHGSVTNDPRPVALFNTIDALSGIAYYNVRVNGNGIVRLESIDVNSNPYAVPVQGPGTSTLTVAAYDNAGNSTIASSEFTVNGLDAPTLDPIKNISEGDILQVSGLTYPNARIDVYLKDSGGNVTSQWARTTSNGAFRLIWTTHLDRGDYTVTAQTTDDTGAISFISAPQTLKIQLQPYALLKDILFNYLPFTFMMIALLLTGGYFMGFPLIRRFIKPMSIPAHAQLHEQFSELRDALTQEMFAMRHAKTKRQLSDEEEHFLEHFEKLLNKAEKNIEKDILRGK